LKEAKSVSVILCETIISSFLQYLTLSSARGKEGCIDSHLAYEFNVAASHSDRKECRILNI